LGIKCSIEKENGGHCTGWDGIIDKEIHIEKNSNGWKALQRVVEAIPCDSCRDDGLDNLNALHDVVNLTIGETDKAHNPKNLIKFARRVEKALESCQNCHEVE